MTRTARHKDALLWGGVLAAACTIGLMAGQVSAQTVDVTFDTKAGTGSVSGRLVEITGRSFVLATAAGQVEVRPQDVVCTGRACPVAGFVPREEVPAAMRRIMLSSLDKKIEIEGELKGLPDARLLVDVAGLGLVSFERRGLRCSGPGCLVTQAMMVPLPPRAEPLQIVGPRDLTEGMLAGLLKGYAASVSAPADLQPLSDSTYVMALDPDAGTFFVGGTGPTVSFDALASGAADIVIAGRQPTDAEAEAIAAAGLGELRGSAFGTALAADAVAIVTHPDLPVSELTSGQLAALYNGTITNWSDVGGPDAPVTVFMRERGADEKALFGAAVFGDAQQRAERGVVVAGSSREMHQKLAGTPFSIGYLWNTQSEGLNTVRIRGECGVTGAQDHFALKAGDAWMGTRLYLYSRPGATNPAAARFAEYAGTAMARDALALAGYVSPDIMRVPLAEVRAAVETTGLASGEQTQMALQISQRFGQWDRLSTTFRGDANSAVAGPEMTRLVAYLQTLPEGSEVAVIGFASGGEGFDVALATSRAQADAIAQELAAQVRAAGLRTNIGFAGYGNLVPLACDSDHGADQLNSRVEIWVRDPN
ncbi:MAG: substrate-binding domain-containing protein [Sulfitobacter sp.]|nr:substrate-binding domain-containing protein [Sulfitobacter sp.]